VRRTVQRNTGYEHTCFPFGERYVTPGFILNELDLYLSAPCLLVRLGLIVIVIFISTTLVRSIVVDERVISDGSRQRRRMIARSWVAWKVCALALAHCR
jgi:hypothetical protein